MDGDTETMRRLRGRLLAYYRRHGRDLPWRRTSDAYAIWVSEIMLQQTQVETVRPRFVEFLRRFPDVASLAAVDEATVCEAWAGLGYYRRARNLHRAARMVVTELGGELPRDVVGLSRLPGIGRYTAAAIASIAFDQPVAAVDGNLVRVLARVFALPGRPDQPELVRAVRQQGQALVDGPRPGDVNQALMDLGATVCRPERPACADCPISSFCRARAGGDATAYPGRAAPIRRKSLRVAFAWCSRGDGILLEQRPLDGLWSGLWELPSASGPSARRVLGERLGQALGVPLLRITHELTHRHVTASVHRATAPAGSAGRWWQDPLSAPLSALARKAIMAVRALPASGPRPAGADANHRRPPRPTTRPARARR